MTSAENVKKLRERTGLGVLECHKILKDAGGSFKKALSAAKEKLGKDVRKKDGRETKEGAIVSYIHLNNKVGVLLELLCETDFVARNEEFKKLASDLAVHIAALDPKFVSANDAPADLSLEEKEEKSLLSQDFFKDPNKKVKDLVAEKIQKMGENIKIGRFVRYQL